MLKNFVIQDNKRDGLFTIAFANSLPATEDGIIGYLNIKMNKQVKDGSITFTKFEINEKPLDIELLNKMVNKTSLPSRFYLAQNYPNPFNPETIIQYELPEQSRVQITIYNITGQVVRTLVNEIKPAGYHRIVWDCKNQAGIKVSSGIYLYRMVTNKFVKINKMVLIK